MSAPAFPAPVDASAPDWADEASSWEWDEVEQAWTRPLCRLVGGEVSGVLLSALQTSTAAGTVATGGVELVVPAGAARSAVVHPEELDGLIAALTAARDLMCGPVPAQRTCDDDPVRS